MFSDLKKKKKPKKVKLDFDDEPPAEAEDAGEFVGIKTKKKPKKAAFDLDAFEKELEQSNAAGGQGEGGDGDIRDEEDLGEDVFAVDAPRVEGGDEKEPWLGSDRDYTYQELLARIFRTMQAQNPDFSSSRKRYTIVPPSVHRDGNKKTVFANIADICKRMHRQPEHVIQFIFAELGTTGSVDGEKRLVIRGRFQQKQLENVLRRYIVEYVTCKTCKSPDTLLTKENRLYFMSCEACGSRRSVSAIKTGFQAQVGKRPKKLQ
jgi:translation initiation factor 2 subunit 2